MQKRLWQRITIGLGIWILLPQFVLAESNVQSREMCQNLFDRDEAMEYRSLLADRRQELRRVLWILLDVTEPGPDGRRSLQTIGVNGMEAQRLSWPVLRSLSFQKLKSLRDADPNVAYLLKEYEQQQSQLIDSLR